MHIVKLTQISSSHNNVRTKSTIGVCCELPRKHSRFLIMAKPIEPDQDFRIIDTSPVIKCKRLRIDQNIFNFTTQNSKYRLVIINTI